MRAMLKVFFYPIAALVAAEATLVGVLEAVSSLRRRLREGPQEPFPQGDWSEVRLELGDERLKLYPGYEGLYEAMLAEIERAEERIFLETFIFKVKNDEVGRRFAETLGRKAREGVEVCVIYDALASLTTSADLFPEGVHVLPYGSLPGSETSLGPHNCVRDHRKILAVDGRVTFLGGFNIAAEYATGWRDTHVRVRGDVVREVEDAFAEFWNKYRTRGLPEIAVPRQERDWNPAALLRINDPTMGLFPIRTMFLAPMHQAKKRIYLTTVYFVPSRAIKDALADAAKRGVDVQVLLPKQSTYALADWLARRHFSELLRAGVRIFEYDEHYVIHSKTATVDGVWSTVGSANIDSLSLFGLHEINLEVYSERFAGQMEEMFEMDKMICEEVTPEKWKRRPLAYKLVERALALLRPFA